MYLGSEGSSEKHDSQNTSWRDEIEEIDRAIQSIVGHCGSEAKEIVAQTEKTARDRRAGQRYLTKQRQWVNPMLPEVRENDEERIAKRERQIEIGKNTAGYREYIRRVDKEHRRADEPQTPEKMQKCSTRSWQSQMNIWRRKLHFYDSEEEKRGLPGGWSSNGQTPTKKVSPKKQKQTEVALRKSSENFPLNQEWSQCL